MSLYAQYLKERGNKNIIEDQYGFAVYSPYKEGIYLEDIYVEPALRKSGLAKELHDKVVEITKQLGLKKIYGSVVPSINQKASTNPTEMVKWMFSQGYSLDECFNGIIILSKEVI